MFVYENIDINKHSLGGSSAVVKNTLGDYNAVTLKTQ